MSLSASGGSVHRDEIEFRAAQSGDFPELFRLTLAGLGLDALVERVGPCDAHPFHPHALDHGQIIVAAHGDAIVGYASAIERSGYRILSQVFVRDEAQSAGVGRSLVDAIDVPSSGNRLLVSSSDPRASGLYIRRGYVPGWPIYTLDLSAAALSRLPTTPMRSEVAQVTNTLVDIDRQVAGRERSADLEYMATSLGAGAYLHYYDENVTGYALIHDPLSGTMNAWYQRDASLHIGPVGALMSRDARETVLATLDVVRQAFPGRGATIEIGGPHPALSTLLQAGARIVDAETFMATDLQRFGNPGRYVPSGGVLY